MISEGLVLFGASMLLRRLLTSASRPAESSPALQQHHYERELRVAVHLARAAGARLLSALHDAKSVTCKDADRADFVTATDQHIEAMIFDGLKTHFPTHKFIGEESCAIDGLIPPLSDEPTWIVDPIDGTTNFIHSNPMTCVSIGFMVNKVPVVGVVYAPCLDELYVAVRGQGAYLNSKRLLVSQARRIQDAIIVNEFGYVRDRAGIKHACRCLERLLTCNPHSLREYGSGVLDLAFLAAGRVDAVFCGVSGNGWKPWDYAAGWLLVTEAGGVLSTLSGGEFHTHASSMIGAATPALSQELVEVLAQASSL